MGQITKTKSIEFVYTFDDHAPIKKGDWCVSIFNEVVQADEDFPDVNKCNLRKITSTTDDCFSA